MFYAFFTYPNAKPEEQCLALPRIGTSGVVILILQFGHFRYRCIGDGMSPNLALFDKVSSSMGPEIPRLCHVCPWKLPKSWTLLLVAEDREFFFCSDRGKPWRPIAIFLGLHKGLSCVIPCHPRSFVALCCCAILM